MTDATTSTEKSAQDGADTDEPIAPPQYKGLKAAVIIMGIALVVGFAVLFGTIVYRAMNMGAEEEIVAGTPDGTFGVSEIAIGKGDRVGSVTLSESRLAVRVAGSAYHDIIIIDVETGRELGRVRLRALSDFAAHDANAE